VVVVWAGHGAHRPSPLRSVVVSLFVSGALFV
jgi:hypothetical protein